MFEVNLTIPESDLTPVYRHIHHAQTLRYLEWGRLKYLEAVDYPTEHFLEKGLFLVITDISISYKRELFAEPVIITCEDVEFQERKILIGQKIVKEDRRKVAVDARVTSVLMNGATKRSVAFTDEFIQAVSRWGC